MTVAPSSLGQASVENIVVLHKEEDCGVLLLGCEGRRKLKKEEVEKMKQTYVFVDERAGD